jgi:hypothetical protein
MLSIFRGEFIHMAIDCGNSIKAPASLQGRETGMFHWDAWNN